VIGCVRQVCCLIEVTANTSLTVCYTRRPNRHCKLYGELAGITCERCPALYKCSQNNLCHIEKFEICVPKDKIFYVLHRPTTGKKIVLDCVLRTAKHPWLLTDHRTI